MNNNINPILYDSFLHLRNSLGARIVHRRKRNEAKHLATAVDVSFEPIIAKKPLFTCTIQKKAVPLQPQRLWVSLFPVLTTRRQDETRTKPK